jgi:hypothetical protein
MVSYFCLSDFNNIDLIIISIKGESITLWNSPRNRENSTFYCSNFEVTNTRYKHNM